MLAVMNDEVLVMKMVRAKMVMTKVLVVMRKTGKKTEKEVAGGDKDGDSKDGGDD